MGISELNSRLDNESWKIEAKVCSKTQSDNYISIKLQDKSGSINIKAFYKEKRILENFEEVCCDKNMADSLNEVCLSLDIKTLKKIT